MTPNVQKSASTARMMSLQENTQNTMRQNSQDVGRKQGSRNPHSTAAIRRMPATIAAPITAFCAVGSSTQAISGSSARSASSRKPMAIARNAQKQEGGHG